MTVLPEDHCNIQICLCSGASNHHHRNSNLFQNSKRAFICAECTPNSKISTKIHQPKSHVPCSSTRKHCRPSKCVSPRCEQKKTQENTCLWATKMKKDKKRRMALLPCVGILVVFKKDGKLHMSCKVLSTRSAHRNALCGFLEHLTADHRAKTRLLGSGHRQPAAGI